MTKLSKPVSRETAKVINSRPVVLTICPAGSKSEALIEFRLKGQRTGFIGAVSDLYRVVALWHANAEMKAKKEARKMDVPWHKARKEFLASRELP